MNPSNPSQCKQFEIEIVDNILGNLPSNRSQALQHHLAECRPCRNLYEEWHEILKDNKSIEPSAFLYKRLKKNFLRQQVKHKLLRRSTLWGVASVAMIGILMLVIAAFQGKQPLDSWKQLPVASEDIPLFVTDDTKTVQYLINPQKGQLTSIEGIVWVNSHLDEIYCYV